MTTLRTPLQEIGLPARPRRTEATGRLTLPDPGRPVDVLIIAGEHSGDEHGARLLREARQREPGLQVCALGGPELAAAGAHVLHDLTASSVVGLVEVLKNYGFFKALFAATIDWIVRHRPRAVLFVDYPGFNLRLAAALRERGISVKGGGSVRLLFYISPQIWAWKARRRFTMARDLDALAVIFPFEVACYQDTTLPVTFVGHPFVADDYVAPVRNDPAAPILLLPGSRRQAVSRIFPVLLAGYRAYEQDAASAGPPGPRTAQVIYPSEPIANVLKAHPRPDTVQLRPLGGTVSASAVLTSSGTMSMHCALAGLPGAVVYRANPLTYLMGRYLVKVPYLGIANLLLNEPMYPEFIQGAATPAALAGQLRDCLGSAERRARTSEQARRLRNVLQQPAGASAASWLLARLNAD